MLVNLSAYLYSSLLNHMRTFTGQKMLYIFPPKMNICFVFSHNGKVLLEELFGYNPATFSSTF